MISRVITTSPRRPEFALRFVRLTSVCSPTWVGNLFRRLSVIDMAGFLERYLLLTSCLLLASKRRQTASGYDEATRSVLQDGLPQRTLCEMIDELTKEHDSWP